MVELKLRSVGETNLPKDCFISVRVGDMQKFSRFQGSRSYSFKKHDNGFGKIEVFRRLGACNFAMDSLDRGARAVDISCFDADCKNLSLAVEKEDASSEPIKPGENCRVNLAKEYLDKHGVEIRLSEAMLGVIRDRPDDPLEYIASQLMKWSRDSRQRSTPSGTTATEDIKANVKSTPIMPVPEVANGGVIAAASARELAPIHDFAQWSRRPSVGTWLLARPTPPADGAGEQLEIVGTRQAIVPVASLRTSWQPRVTALRRLKGLNATGTALPDQVWEVERLLAKAFLRLPSDFAGKYLPLPGSVSYAPRPGGMTDEEASSLEIHGLLFSAAGADGVSGRGVFCTTSGSFAAWVNEGDHVRLISMDSASSDSALSALERFEGALVEALAVEGHGFVT
mmetsp:Transcript_137560/g.343250  ORF Transcript_137560/g.343250 Transcript_137560/m.343250 type:complete len:397 (-) Transcript_137560:273-1463(-)